MESKIKITSFEDGIIIKISGELDSSKTMLYKEKIHQIMRTLGPRYMIWDLKDLTFLDSAGIGLILGRYNEIEKIISACSGRRDHSRHGTDRLWISGSGGDRGNSEWNTDQSRACKLCGAVYGGGL